MPAWDPDTDRDERDERQSRGPEQRPTVTTVHSTESNTPARPSWNADEYLKSKGVSEHVRREEAAKIQRYGSAEALERANPGTLARYLSRTNSSGGGSPTPPPRPPSDPRFVPSGFNAFNDPYTKQFEGILQQQMELYRAQQEEMRRAAEEARLRRAEAERRRQTLEAFIGERVGKLKGPAYTGAEGEVLRTQLLDPIERDRSAAQKAALERISARGMTPESGLAAELQRLVDQEFNQYRAQAQGGLATRQIEEQRSREQEAQQLLEYLAQLPEAAARGDLDFLSTVQGRIAQPGTQQIALGDILAELPSKRLRDALATLGVAPSPGMGTSPQAMQLLQLLSQQRALEQGQFANYFGNLGLSFQPR